MKRSTVRMLTPVIVVPMAMSLSYVLKVNDVGGMLYWFLVAGLLVILSGIAWWIEKRTVLRSHEDDSQRPE